MNCNSHPTGLNHQDVSVRTVDGEVSSGILELSKETGSELVILGFHGDVTFKDLFRSTTVKRVVRGACEPVLLVKNRISGSYSSLAIGVDFSIYSRRDIEFAIKFTPGGRFHLAHAYDVPFKGFIRGENVQEEVKELHEKQLQSMIEKEMADFLSALQSAPPKLEAILQQGMIREVLCHQTNRLRPDLLVVGSSCRTGVARAIFGSVAEDTLDFPPCDVLVV